MPIMKKGEKQLNIPIPKEIKKQLQLEALMQEKSIKDLVIGYILKGLGERNE